MADIVSSLAEFGADPAALHLFEKDSPDLLPYATLVAAQRSSDSLLGIVGAVYEWQDAPLIFLVDADQFDDREKQIRGLRRLLAMRGDAPYLGVVTPGHLDVYHIALDSKTPRKAKVNLKLDQGSKYATIAQLASARPDAGINHPNWIFNVILKLLTGSIDKLTALEGVSKEEAISLVGRALFTRFLADRKLLPAKMSSAHVEAGLFDNPQISAKTSSWLDKTFNGDFLPLSDATFKTLPDQAYHVLRGILTRADDGQLYLGWEVKWNHLDFAHIPVGVLSQAYEQYLREHEPDSQRKKGGYYTPRPIADLMVRASFLALEREGKGSTAKILDPAAGAGVFLLTAFRELVAQRWKADGKRPNTKTLRSILYRQVVGFDIDEAALRFAALGLYLMSIELDPKPKPVDKLRFNNLRGKVLHLIAQKDEDGNSELGSLGPLIGDEHHGQYDLVIGNPPWASSTKLNNWGWISQTVARIAQGRGISNQSPPLPNEVLDLPFVWRAMEWAKPNSQIAFALHARLLFQQGDGMPKARLALFEALDVTSVINGAEIRYTKVWPQIKAPFCLLFAVNRVPKAGAGFRLINPRLEMPLNKDGIMRIDANDADIILNSQLVETPEILKILFRGSKADLGLVERIKAQGHPTLSAFWCEAIGVSKGRLLGSGTGYQKRIKSSRIRKNGDGLPGCDASYLQNLPEINKSSFTSIFIDTQQLKPFSEDRIHDPRSLEIFTGPLLVVHKSILTAVNRIRVAIAEQDAVFTKSFYGYSPINYEAAEILIRYLALVLGSKLALWMALITSGEFGFERETVEKATLDGIAIPDFRKLAPKQRCEIESKFDDLNRDKASWEDIDQWVVSLYGLGTRDLQVISDTLEFNLPFAKNKDNAQSSPTRQDIERFCRALEQELIPWAQRFGSSLAIDLPSSNPVSPWFGIRIRTVDPRNQNAIPTSDWEGLLRAADSEAASEMFFYGQNGELLIGRLAQRRYWSGTQARLLAQRIIWSHLGFLRGNIDA